MAELTLEKFAGKIEGTAGTAETAPTHDLGFSGLIDPKQEYVQMDVNYGLLADSTDNDVLTEESADWSGDGDANTATLPWWLNLAVKGAVTANETNNKLVASVGSITGGSGYSASGWAVTFTGGTPIIAAHGTATTDAGAITGVTITNPGLGYASVPTVDFSAGGGTGGSGTAVLSTPSSAKLWKFNQTETSDDLKSFTLWWGDPNVQILRSAYAKVETLTFSADAAGKDLVKMKAKGFAQFPEKVSPPAWAAALTAYGLSPKGIQLWIDPSTNDFGTTPVTGRVVSADLELVTGVVAKFLAAGPGVFGFTRTGRKKGHHTLSLVVEFLDTTQYDLAVAAGSAHGGVRVKMRCRWNGPLIETTGGVSYYHFLQVDILGRLSVGKWGAAASTNRTLALEVASSYRSADSTSLSVYVQNVRTSL